MTNNIIILGKPNAGKSSLLNALLGKQIAVVNDYEGLTRDLKEIEININEKVCSVIDSPGITNCKSLIEKEIKKKTILSIEKCDLIFLVIDGKKNLTSEDFEIFNIVRKSQKKTLLIINKTEGQINEALIDECSNLGFGLPIKISTAHMQGIDHLKYLVTEIFHDETYGKPPSEVKELSIAIVGKTNSGKSTLFNKLTKANVLSKDMLFASLDSTIRKSFFKNMNFVFVDTVGFIRDLPTTLIDAFKSTLDEIIYSDLILHVRDISSQYYLEQRNEVIKILDEIGIYNDDQRIIEVINKVDLIENLNKHHNSFSGQSVHVSALSGEGIEELKTKIAKKIT